MCKVCKKWGHVVEDCQNKKHQSMEIDGNHPQEDMQGKRDMRVLGHNLTPIETVGNGKKEKNICPLVIGGP